MAFTCLSEDIARRFAARNGRYVDSHGNNSLATYSSSYLGRVDRHDLCNCSSELYVGALRSGCTPTCSRCHH